MRGPSLQKTAFLSFALHLTAFFLVFLILRQSNSPIIPSPYTVNLVSPEFSPGRSPGGDEEHVRETRESLAPEAPAETPKKSKKETIKERKLAQARIDELQKKKRKLDTLKRLREIVTLKAQGGRKGVKSNTATTPAGSSGSSEDYSAKIMSGIHQYWTLPPGAGKKGLETVVAIKILRDGTIVVQRTEKKSGNALFDRSALQALAKATPLPPPPNEMELSVRFYP